MKKVVLASAPVTVFCSLPAHAAPDQYVDPVRVEAGEREIDFKFGVRNMRDSSKDHPADSI